MGVWSGSDGVFLKLHRVGLFLGQGEFRHLKVAAVRRVSSAEDTLEAARVGMAVVPSTLDVVDDVLPRARVVCGDCSCASDDRVACIALFPTSRQDRLTSRATDSVVGTVQVSVGVPHAVKDVPCTGGVELHVTVGPFPPRLSGAVHFVGILARSAVASKAGGDDVCTENGCGEVLLGPHEERVFERVDSSRSGVGPDSDVEVVVRAPLNIVRRVVGERTGQTFNDVRDGIQGWAAHTGDRP